MPANDKKTFEENLTDLEAIVTRLERGDVPLEEALTQFQAGVGLSQELQKTLAEAEKTLTKMINDQGQAVAFDTSDAN
ncbi:exodeoxyribonuclease VII small subunit [Periweissella ghanensis]|uniref:Exodeoxyribonuclease 7 small subunit n=1 Tax=Periweissella ghanensis TaxID=467997 RepID=A0ABN8BPL7_9LACO|nr:exodeoxyribonuclease VII small subunit [Periweissella ghanensis]MCM0600741.1 exodeoxyribonuclease VII small subunit [Periweissella ghanensis]CAH0418556.1 Exodeoxyribonuclease 7 small subunit [Periweissella ghanensis]